MDTGLMLGMLVGMILVLAMFALAHVLGTGGLAPDPAKAELPAKTFPSLTFGKHTVEQKVLWRNRPTGAGNNVCKAILYLTLLAQFLFGFLVLFTQNAMISIPQIPSAEEMEEMMQAAMRGEDVTIKDCIGAPEGWVRLGADGVMPAIYCSTPEMNDEYNACMAADIVAPEGGGLMGGLSGFGGPGGSGCPAADGSMLSGMCVGDQGGYPENTGCPMECCPSGDGFCAGMGQADPGNPFICDWCNNAACNSVFANRFQTHAGQTVNGQFGQMPGLGCGIRRLEPEHGPALVPQVQTVWQGLAAAKTMLTVSMIRQYAEVRQTVKASFQNNAPDGLARMLLHVPGNWNAVDESGVEDENHWKDGSLPASADLWSAIGDFPEIPAVLMLGLLLIIPLWLTALRMFTKQMVWGTLLLDFGGIVYLMVKSDFATPTLVFGGVFILVVIACRKKIMTAIEILHVATVGLGENPGVFLACAFVFIAFIGYMIFWELALLSFANSIQIKTHRTSLLDSCVAESATAGIARPMFLALLVPTTFYFMNVKLVVCATGLGAWYFHSDDPEKPKRPSLVGLKWGFFDAAGPAYLAAVLQYAVHEMRKMLNTGAGKVGCNPPVLGIILKIIWCMFENTLKALTKFMLLGHIFHGGDVIDTARNAFAVLKNHLGQAIMTDSIAFNVTQMSLAVISVGWGFMAMAWMEANIQTGVLTMAFSANNAAGEAMDATPAPGMESINSSSDRSGPPIPPDILVLVFGALLYGFALKPFRTIIGVGLLQNLINTLDVFGNMLIGFFAGILVASIAAIFFGFTAQIVHNSADVIMYCYALERECGGHQERFSNMYGDLKKTGMVQEGTPAGSEKVADGKEVVPNKEGEATI